MVDAARKRLQKLLQEAERRCADLKYAIVANCGDPFEAMRLGRELEDAERERHMAWNDWSKVKEQG
jgi:hypothetical protein